MKSCKTPFLGFLHTFFLPVSESSFVHCAARVLCNGRSRPGLHIGGQLQGGDCSGPSKHRLQPVAASLCCVFRTASFSKPFSERIQYNTGNFDCQGAGGPNFSLKIPVFSTFFFNRRFSADSTGNGRTGTGWQTPAPRRPPWPASRLRAASARTAAPLSRTRRHKRA